MGQLSGGLHRSWVTIYDPLSALQNGIKRYGRNTNRKSYVFCPMAPFSIIIEHVLRSNQETIYFSLKKTIPREIYACGSRRHHRCPVCFLPVKNSPPSDFGLGGGLRSRNRPNQLPFAGLIGAYSRNIDFFRTQSHYNYFRASVE